MLHTRPSILDAAGTDLIIALDHDGEWIIVRDPAKWFGRWSWQSGWAGTRWDAEDLFALRFASCDQALACRHTNAERLAAE